MKFGLNLFISQLIALVSLLVILCISIMLALYYTNNESLKNNELLLKEEIEKNSLNQINILVSSARQTEKSFYAKANPEDPDFLLKSLRQALKSVQQIKDGEKGKYGLESHGYNYQLIESIEKEIIEYISLFRESVLFWEKRGYNRESGLGLNLKLAAYNGLRKQLNSYHTETLLTSIYHLRWLEYEYYNYGKPYLVKLKQQVKVLTEEIEASNLTADLTHQLLLEINQFNQLLDKKVANKTVIKGALEQHTKNLLTIIIEHSITNFSLLVQTLLYYEMEYRTLGQQNKHVEAVYQTVEKLKYRIDSSAIPTEKKTEIINYLFQYSEAFSQLVALDKKIIINKNSISQSYEQLTKDINLAIKNEQKSMLEIQNKMYNDNIKNTMINFIVTAFILVFALIVVSMMVKKMNQKVTNIGRNLKLLSKGDFNIEVNLPNKSRRDELDWISYFVQQLSHDLSDSMGTLKKQNNELEVISNKLSKYLSPQIYRSIFTGKHSVNIQSKRKKLSIFFSDIVSFTSITDHIESEDLTHLLNEYLNEMSIIALKHGGTIDKFIGDAIMIFFGDPESKGEQKDCLACVHMALDMRSKMNELDKQWNSQGYAQAFKIRMGISSGYCTVGNFGSNERMDYTIIGGQVNLASRLESHAKSNQILISHEAYSLVKDQFYCKPQEKIHLKGFSEPVQSYQVIDYIDFEKEEPIVYSYSSEGVSINIDEKLVPTDDRSKLRETLENLIKKLS